MESGSIFNYKFVTPHFINFLNGFLFRDNSGFAVEFIEEIALPLLSKTSGEHEAKKFPFL